MPRVPTEPPSSSSPAPDSGIQDSADSFLQEVAAVTDPSLEAVVPPRLQASDVIADRFVVERLAGRGGMGAVYRALDLMTGAPVALKVMATGGGRDDERFTQEASVLAQLNHPAIVRYVVHGRAREGQAFLAMEWLDGEDLGQRLARAGLSAAESLAVARRVAEGLAAAHARGVVHRDVKPSNVFLVGSDPARAKLLDFGIVRLQLTAHDPTARPITGTGAVIGTVGYMSPEQAIADRALDARTDVFALGCVLFECLTGEPVFSGAQVVAVLAKVLREEAPRLRQLRPDLPAPLDDLVARMLAKDKTMRPVDGAAVLRELDGLGAVSGHAPAALGRPAPGLSEGEQRLVSVLLAFVPDEPDRLDAIVRRHGGEHARLANGALLVTLASSRGSTAEQVLAAAGCALQLRDAFPPARIALAMGRAQTTGGGRPGAVIDRAAALLAPLASPGIRVDEATVALLEARFEIRGSDEGRALIGRRAGVDAPRTLLGKPTPCVGRDKELALLEATWRECAQEPVARAVLLTGPAGQGKSRLRHELVGRVTHVFPDARVLMARADPVGAGSAFVMVRQIVRQAVGLREGDPADEQHARLRAHVAGVCKPADAERIADFLGELLAVPSTGRPSPQLRVARDDPRLMAEWLRRSFGEWLAAECSARPLLVVLEDLHWGDQPSAAYLGEGLRALTAQPFMVLALARPEVYEAFPSLWAGADMIEIPLGKLTPRAAEKLVTSALGDAPSAETIARIVQRADGNAFYLEELIRRASEGGGDDWPETVLALVESRLEKLEPDARRVVRAASVLGEIFWRGAVAQLTGGAPDMGDVDGWLESLVEREVLRTRVESRFANEREYAFRHGLLRDAAYAMLTEKDRSAGHRLAGEWLERAGEKDALTLADHFEKGGDAERAVAWILRAAEAAYDGGSARDARALAERGIPHATGERLGMLDCILGASAGALNDMEHAFPALREAMALLTKGSRHWFVAASSLAFYGTMAGNPTTITELAEGVASLPPEFAHGGLYAQASARAVLAFMHAGRPERAKAFLERMEAAPPESTDDLSFAGWLALARAYGNTYCAGGDVATVVSNARRAVSLFEQVGDSVALTSARVWQAGMGALSLGRHEEVEDGVAKGITSARQSGNWSSGSLLEMVLWVDRISTRDPIDCVEHLAQIAKMPNLVLALHGVIGLSLAYQRSGDATRAELLAREALERSSRVLPPVEYGANAALARACLALGCPEASLEAAQRALAAPVQHVVFASMIAPDLSAAEALMALGRRDEAHAAILEARDRVLGTAARLEEADRASYLTNVEDNVGILALAREWLGS